MESTIDKVIRKYLLLFLKKPKKQNLSVASEKNCNFVSLPEI